jgi:uncharacterized YigZ family protein
MMLKLKHDVKIEITEKKSRFITRLFPVSSEDDAKEKLKVIKESEKGAVHNCYAYRIFSGSKNIVERKSDDGEPGGTAGAPMLAVLAGNNTVNIFAVTTRYFGGIKLGTGGLASVYKRGVVEALKNAVLLEYREVKKYEVKSSISKKHDINILEKNFSEESCFIIETDEEKLLILKKNISPDVNIKEL